MALFQSFVGTIRAKVVDIVSQKMEQGGSQAVSYAKAIVPVKTGQLQASISYYWNRGEMRLTLVADKPYAAFVEQRHPYLRPALRLIGRPFGIASLEIQFPNLPPQYHKGMAQLLSGKHGVLIGHRNVVRTKR